MSALIRWLVYDLFAVLLAALARRLFLRYHEATVSERRQDAASLTLITRDGSPLLLSAATGAPEDSLAARYEGPSYQHVPGYVPRRGEEWLLADGRNVYIDDSHPESGELHVSYAHFLDLDGDGDGSWHQAHVVLGYGDFDDATWAGNPGYQYNEDDGIADPASFCLAHEWEEAHCPACGASLGRWCNLCAAPAPGNPDSVTEDGYCRQCHQEAIARL